MPGGIVDQAVYEEKAGGASTATAADAGMGSAETQSMAGEARATTKTWKCLIKGAWPKELTKEKDKSGEQLTLEQGTVYRAILARARYKWYKMPSELKMPNKLN
eukprot:3943894-Amphidinium_carterae.1